MPDPRHTGEWLAGCYVVSFEVDVMKSKVIFVVSMLVVSFAVVATAQTGAEDSPRPVIGRSMVVTGHGIVAASQPLAARAGVQVLERGGNAIDAAIAANATIGLMEPTGNGIGGDLFALIYEAETGELYGLNASGWAPSGRTVEFLRSKGFDEVPGRGIYSVTVPGVVAGWDMMRERFGSLPFSESLAPAIYYAENGFPVSPVISRGWARSSEMLAAHPNSKETFLPGGQAPKLGEMFRNPDLGASLRRIAEHGRDGYYKGQTAEAILKMSEEMGGTFTADDLSEFRPQWVTPISTMYRGWKVSEIPPNTQGIAALIMLNLMEQYPIGEYGFHSAKALHVAIEAKKLAYADMLGYVGDPDFSQIPVEPMLSKAHAAERAKLIDPAQAACEVSPSYFPGITTAEGNDTIYMTTIDKDGNIVSLIQSNYSGFGSGLVPPGVGFMLHNRGALFTMEEGHANTVEPRKRPLHTIIPAFMEKDGVQIGFGIMGGWNQAQAHAQFVANIVDFGFNIQEALEAGRFTKGSFTGCDVNVESLIPANVRTELTALGHELSVRPPRTGGFGHGQAVMGTPEGIHFGASEPRHDGAAVPQAPSIFDR